MDWVHDDDCHEARTVGVVFHKRIKGSTPDADLSPTEARLKGNGYLINYGSLDSAAGLMAGLENICVTVLRDFQENVSRMRTLGP